MACSSRRRQSHSFACRDSFVSKAISPAIRGKTCPICLSNIHERKTAILTVCMHAYCLECILKWSNLKRTCPLCNATFNAWFFNINLQSRTFHKKQLPDLNEVKFEAELNRRNRLAEQRVIRRPRDEFNGGNWRTRPLPQRRTFGRPGSVPPDVVAERVHQWRSSIYCRRLQAVPSSSSRTTLENVLENNGVKERILRRIEPWIWRELQAILSDPDPSVIIHVASSLFISSLEDKNTVSSQCVGAEDDYLAPLRAFLHEWTNMFWHELRCFAESSLTMETYDMVVEYKRMD